MTENEKQAIEKFKNIIATYQDVIDEQDWYSYEEIESAKEYQEVAEKILAILYKQQKEIENLELKIATLNSCGGINTEYCISKDKVRELANKIHKTLDVNGITRAYQITIDCDFRKLLGEVNGK